MSEPQRIRLRRIGPPPASAPGRSASARTGPSTSELRRVARLPRDDSRRQEEPINTIRSSTDGGLARGCFPPSYFRLRTTELRLYQDRLRCSSTQRAILCDASPH